MKIHKGGCLCGEISYEVAGQLRDVVACHCHQCRKTSGHYVAATSCETQNLKIVGEPTWFTSSLKARRGFCGTCGSNLFWQPGNRKRTSIFAGTLDSDSGIKMASQIHIETKGSYYDLPDVPIGKQEPIEED
ncbi:MAG: GFA family protein [Pseudomonadota bacterium]